MRQDRRVTADQAPDGDDARAHNETRTGRPRDPSRDAAILGATLDLLGEVSYDQVTVRAIAQRSGTGLATIYRRWPTKEDLVVDAVASYNEPPLEAHTTDDPEAAALAIVSRFAEVLRGRHQELLPNLIGQLPINPALASAFRAKVIEPRLEMLADRLAETSGATPERARESAELLPASLFFQALIMDRTLSEAEVRRIVRAAIRALSG